jgi:hypothetical protein
MLARHYWRIVTADSADLLERLIRLLTERAVPYCVVGGQAVNAYVEPLVSLDLDLAVAISEAESLEQALAGEFIVERFPHSPNVSGPGSDLRVQFQLDPRYEPFVGRAVRRTILGLELPVAAIEDVLQGKIWAAQDPQRRASKRQKDLADIARLIEARPDLRAAVPQDVLDRLL